MSSASSPFERASAAHTRASIAASVEQSGGAVEQGAAAPTASHTARSTAPHVSRNPGRDAKLHTYSSSITMAPRSMRIDTARLIFFANKSGAFFIFMSAAMRRKKKHNVRQKRISIF
jgi:hypothetical protein